MKQGCDIEGEGSSALLSHRDPSPVSVVNPSAGAAFLIVCDHAGRRIPEALGSLGLEASVLEQHIAWDIGAAGVSRALAERLGAPAVLQAYSRLVVDCNRAPRSADAVPAASHGQPIPGNADLGKAAIDVRYREIFDPYHAAIAAEVERLGRPVLVAIHSFTPELAGFARPWSFGVLHDGRSPFSASVLEALASQGLAVGDNEPYAMDGTDFTIPHHAIGRGLDYLELEIRQDMIATAEGQAAVAARLAQILPDALGGGA